MMKRDNKTYRNWLCLLWLAVFTSCMDETFTASDVEGTFISIRGMAPHTGSVHSGTPEDYIIHTLRVLAFDKTTGDKVTNLFYNAHSGDIMRHMKVAVRNVYSWMPAWIIFFRDISLLTGQYVKTF